MTSTFSKLSAALADRCRIERELGVGGMATVYLAHDLKHERDVAIKVLHPDLGAALGGERLLAEIRTTARLQHPHILPLLDSIHAQQVERFGGAHGVRDHPVVLCRAGACDATLGFRCIGRPRRFRCGVPRRLRALARVQRWQ